MPKTLRAFLLSLGLCAAISFNLLVSYANAETVYDRFKEKMEGAGYTVKVIAHYTSLDPMSWLSAEPYQYAEAQKTLEQNETIKLIQVATYRRSQEKPKIAISNSYYWIACKYSRLRYINKKMYADVIKNETTGYDALGNKLPTNMDTAFNASELAQLGASLPIYDLHSMRKTSTAGDETIPIWERNMLNERLKTECK